MREFVVNRMGLAILTVALGALDLPALAAIDLATGPRYMGHASANGDLWQRIDFRSERLSVRTAPQIKVAIQTRGPAMQGLIRIPGAPASNFDTRMGLTVVNLINVGDEAKGYTEIVALEIVFTQTTPGQYYQVFAVDYDRGN
ncbi:hypothetical protein [Bradyrhizobium liaoningense]|uniref:hypothetical protein n=1 Tax=Bradyrhizobium liaoningense TaxID=43992 RepID=UPI001BA73B71|nr:hypothetical protein [Bradyrhizobium liaoningense]MBR0906331.1 hypothetical protein [Bradyrhizobium liaoningense]